MGKQRSKADIPVNVSAYSLRDVNETLVENRLRDSGFKNVPKSTVQSIVARGGIASKDRKTGESINIPVASLPTQKTYETIKGDIESASELFFQGLTDIPVSVSAGIQQMLAGTDKQKLDAIRKWQDDNTNQLSFAAKRMLENEEMSIEKFMFTAGNTVGQIVGSMATAAAGATVGTFVAPGAGTVGGFIGGMAVNMPFMYNSLLNSARDAGISDADAVGYAYGAGIGLAALESVPLAKIAGWTAKSVAPSLTKSVLNKMTTKYGAKSANELIERIGADKFNKEVAVGVYKAARNGIADRVIGRAGAVGMGALAEGGQEITEFYLEKLAQATYDSTRGEGKQAGKGAFGTQFTQEEFFGKKARDEAFWNGVFGAVGGGFAGTVQAVSSPLYKTGVYDTIDTFVKRGKTVDEAVAALNGIIDRRIGEGELAQDIADTAKSAIQNVAQSYNKIGGKFDEPEFRYVVYERISKKDDLVKELGALESKKAEIQGIVAQNQGDADIYTVDMMEIDKLIDQKQRQLDFTSTWLKDYTQKYYDNKKAKNTARGQFIDDSINDFIVRTDSFDKKKQTPYEFAKEANDAYNAGMKEIDLQYDSQVKSMDITSLNENVNQDFDEIDTIKTKVRTNPSSSENPEFADVVLATDEDGNIAVRRESIIDGQSKVDYIPIANTPQYEPVVARAKSYFENRDSFEGIASKLVLGQELTEDEAELYEDFADNIDGYKEEMERAANFNANLALTKMFAKPIKEALQGMAPTIQRYQERVVEIDETLARDENIPASNQDLNSTKTNEKLSANEIAKLNQSKQALLAEIEKYNQELQRVTEMNPDDSPLEELNSKELALYQTRMAEVDILFNEMVEKFLTNKASNLDDFYGTYGQYGFLRNMEESAKSIAAQKRLFKDSYNPEVANTINKIIDKARILEAKMQEVRAGIEAAKQKQEEAKAAAEQIKLEKQKAKEAEKILKEAKAKLEQEKKKGAPKVKKGEPKKEEVPQEQEVQEEVTETVTELEQVVKEAGDIIIEAANNIEQIRGELTNEQQLPTDSAENESGVQSVQTPTAPVSGASETTFQENVTQGESTPEGEGTGVVATDATEPIVSSGSDDTTNTQGGSTQTQLPNVSGDVKTQEEKVEFASLISGYREGIKLGDVLSRISAPPKSLLDKVKPTNKQEIYYLKEQGLGIIYSPVEVLFIKEINKGDFVVGEMAIELMSSEDIKTLTNLIGDVANYEKSLFEYSFLNKNKGKFTTNENLPEWAVGFAQDLHDRFTPKSSLHIISKDSIGNMSLSQVREMGLSSVVPVLNNISKATHFSDFDNGVNVIVMGISERSKLSWLEIFSHEFGHHIQESLFYSAPKTLQDAIIADYNKWLNKNKKNELKMISSLFGSWMPKDIGEFSVNIDKWNSKTKEEKEFYLSYISQFDEWFAQNTSQYVVTNEKSSDIVSKFFSDIADNIKALYDFITRNKYYSKPLNSFLDAIQESNIIRPIKETPEDKINKQRFNELSSSDVDMPSLDNKSADSLESLLAQKQELLKGNLSPEDRQLVQDQIAEIEGQIKQKAIENNEIVTDTKPEVQALNAYNNIPDVAIKVKVQDTKGLIKVTKGKLGDSLNDETRNVIISDIKQVGDKIQVVLYGDENVVSLIKNSENKVIASNQFNEPITVKMSVDEFVSMFIFGNSSELQRRATLENLGITEKPQSEGTVIIPKGTNVQIAYELGNEVKGKSATLQKSLKIDPTNYKLNNEIGLNTGAILSIADATGKVLYQRGATTQAQEQVTSAQQEAQPTQQGSTNIQNQLLEIKRNGSMTFDSGSQKFFNRFAAGIERIFPGVSIGVLSEQDWIDSGLSPSSRGAFNRKTGQVMLRESMYDGSTFVHEVGHAIMKIIGDVDTNLYNSMLDAVEGTKYEAYVRDNYSNLTTREEILSEAMGYAIQDKGVKMQSRPMAAFRDMMTKAFNAIKKFMGYRTNKDIGDMTLDDFTSEVAGIMFGIKDADIFLDEFDLTQNAELNNYFETEGNTDESSIQYQYFKFQANQQQVAKGIMRGSEYATFSGRVSAGEATMQETIDTLKSIVDSPILESQMASALTTGSGKDKFDGYSFIKANLNDFATDYYNIVTNTDAKNLTPLQNSDIVELGNTMLETYADQHKRSHIEVVQDGKQVQVFVDPAKEASNVNKNVRSFFDAARAKGIMAKYTAKFLTGNMFSNLSNMDTVAQMLSGDNGIMKGIQDLRVQRNKDSARVYNGMRKAIYSTTEKLTQLAVGRGKASKKITGKLTEGSLTPLDEKVNISFHNNFTGEATLENADFTLKDLVSIYLTRQTQVDRIFENKNAKLFNELSKIRKEITKAKKVGNSTRVAKLQKEEQDIQLTLSQLKKNMDDSDVIYDPTVKDGAHLSKTHISGSGRTSVNRGIAFTLDNKQKVNVLLTRDQMKVIDDMFEKGGKYEEDMKVMREFWGSQEVKNVFRESNEVNYRITGKRTAEIQGLYFPIKKAMSDTLRETEIDPNIKNLRFVLETTGLAGNVEGLDIFSIMNEYMEQSTEYIANAEYRDSLRTYRNALAADAKAKNALLGSNDAEIEEEFDEDGNPIPTTTTSNGYDMEVIDSINTALKGIDDMVKSLDSGLKSRRDANRELDKAGIPHRIYNLILSNFSKAVFSFNLGNLFKQSAGYLAGIGQGIVGDKYIYREVGYIGKIIPASMKTYITNDGKLFGKDFNGFFKVKAIEREMEYLEKHEYHFADILRRIQDESAYTGNIELDSLDFVLRKKGKLGDVYRAANKTIFKGLSAMRMNDAAVIIAFVRAARAEVTDLVRNGKLLDAENNPITDVESPKALRLIAEKASELVYRTNNMYMENDKTPLQRSNNILHKSIGLFSSQPQKISNLFAQRFMSAAQDGFKDEEKNKTMRSTMVWAMLAGATLQSSITIMYGILRNGYDEEREYELDFFYEFIRNFTGMFPSLSVEVLNGLLSAIDNAPWTGDIASNPVFSLLENAIKATAALKESIDEDKPEFIRDRKYQEGVRQGADALAKIFGAPTVAVNFIVKQALLEDKK